MQYARIQDGGILLVMVRILYALVYLDELIFSLVLLVLQDLFDYSSELGQSIVNVVLDIVE